MSIRAVGEQNVPQGPMQIPPRKTYCDFNAPHYKQWMADVQLLKIDAWRERSLAKKAGALAIERLANQLHFVMDEPNSPLSGRVTIPLKSPLFKAVEENPDDLFVPEEEGETVFIAEPNYAIFVPDFQL